MDDAITLHYDPTQDDPPHTTQSHDDNDPTKPLYPALPAGGAGGISSINPNDAQKAAMEKLFRDVAGDDMEIDWMELKRLLDQTMRDEFPQPQMNNTSLNAANQTNGEYNDPNAGGGILAAICAAFCKDNPLGQQFAMNEQNNNPTQAPITSQIIESPGFSKDVCRSMVAMLDVDQSGKLGLEEFQTLLTDIARWKAVFKQHDKDDSGKLSAFELSEALETTGYKLSKRVLNALAHRYSSRDGMVAFDDFIMCAVKVKTMMDLFAERNAAGTNTVTFTLEDWMSKTLYS